MKQIGLLLAASTLLSPSAFAEIKPQAGDNLTIEYELAPEKREEFANSMLWKVEASCKISTQDGSNEIFVEALNKKGKINDITLHKGQTLLLTVKQGDKIKVSADAGAKVALTNRGFHGVKATCRT